jgi:hypothetical protein
MSPARSCPAVLAALLVAALAARAPAAPLPKENDFRYLPDNTNLFYVIRVDELLASDGVKKLRKEIPGLDKFFEFESGFRKEYGLELSNVDRMIMGMSIKGSLPISVFRLKKAVDVQAVLKAREEAGFKFDKAIKYKEEKVGAVTWYVTDRELLPEAFCFPNETTVVFGFANDLRPVLERKKEPVLSAVLQAALKEADPRATITVAMDVRAFIEGTKQLSKPDVDYDKFKEAEGISLTINVGDDIALRGVLVCKDAMTAEKAQKQVEAYRTAGLAKLKEMPPGMFAKGALDLPSKVKLSTRDNLVEAAVSLSTDLVIDSFKLRIAATAPDRYALDDSNVLFVVRLDHLLASEAFRKLRDRSPAMLFADDGFRQSFGFGTDRVERVVFGGNTKRDGRFVSVFHLDSGVKAETILKAKARDPQQKPIEEKVGPFTVYAPALGGEGLCLVDEMTLLLGGVKELKEVLARARPANLSSGLREALKQADPGATLMLALDMSALPADRPALPGVDLKKVVDNARAAVLTIKISGRDVALHAAAVCKDDRGAEEVRKQAEAFRDFLGKQASTAAPKEVAELPGRVKFATRGHLVETTLTVKDDAALALIKAFFLPGLDLNPKPGDNRGPKPGDGKGGPPNPKGPPPNLDPKPPVEKGLTPATFRDVEAASAKRVSLERLPELKEVAEKVEALRAARVRLESKLVDNGREVARAEDDLKKITDDFARFARTTAQKWRKFGDDIRDLPTLDAFSSPPTKVKEMRLPDLPVGYNFKKAPGDDRSTDK